MFLHSFNLMSRPPQAWIHIHPQCLSKPQKSLLQHNGVPSTFQSGGCLLPFVGAWAASITDAWVQEVVSRCYELEFCSLPLVFSPQPSCDPPPPTRWYVQVPVVEWLQWFLLLLCCRTAGMLVISGVILGLPKVVFWFFFLTTVQSSFRWHYNAKVRFPVSFNVLPRK